MFLVRNYFVLIVLCFILCPTNAQGRVSSCEKCTKLEGFVSFKQISKEVRSMTGFLILLYGKDRKYRTEENMELMVEIQKKRGVIETGLIPTFIGGADCPEIDSEAWAIDYSHKRPWPALHKGVDIPQNEGTPIRAVAEGVVVGKFMNKRNKKGIEIVLRHTPEQTGLPYWTYSQYTHLLEFPQLEIGAHVKIGEEIGKTSNTGKMGRKPRRDALHFAIWYSEKPSWSNNGRVVLPKDGFFMDPNAFYRLKSPYKSQEVFKLPEEQKNVPVPNMRKNGTFVPPGTKRIWPYACN